MRTKKSKMPIFAEIVHHADFEPSEEDKVAKRLVKKPIAIEDPDPSWPAQYAIVAAKIREALGARALHVEHVGSTSVAGLPAKAVIDVDVTVADPTAEDQYVFDLEQAGFQFLHRDRKWYQHRFFALSEPYANIHVFGEGCPELIRHRMFRDWLRENEDARVKYVEVKRAAAKAVAEEEEAGAKYTEMKDSIVMEILNKALKANGWTD